MRIVNWNVNSIRTRADRVLDFLQRHNVDILAMQETKCKDEQFPYLAFEQAGYEIAHVGYNQWNGVAILSRVGLTDVEDHFPGQPGFHKEPDQPQALEARAIGATCGGVRVWSLYVPNGREIADRHYDYKLRWLDALCRYASQSPELAVYLGDFNIAPLDSDVWDMAAFAGATHVTEPERAAFAMFEEAGLVETTRKFDPGYSYWDYKGARFQRNEGMKIDFQLASPALAKLATGGFIDREERAGKGASDHAPVVMDYRL
ncbi:MAG: exodeoxyribonuclease III [Corynebacterium sp.]|nr:exodeoxyribonuclease III [Corynebacterium sp.]